MSDLSSFLSGHQFNPSNYDSVLNSHSNSADKTCNIDHQLNSNCKYYDTKSIIDEGALHGSDFSLFHHNIRSLSKKASNIVDYLSILNHSFDAIGFTETWFNNTDESNLVDLENYNKIDCIRQERTGGGATLFINNKHNFIQRSDLEIIATDCDNIFIEIPDKNTVIGLIYKPDYVDYAQFISQTEKALSTVTKEKKICFILGDFNIDLLKYQHNHQVDSFVNLMYCYSFFPTINRPTRFITNKRGTSITLIDNIFTNDTDHKINAGNLVTDLSDHFPNFVSIKGHRYQNNTRLKYKESRQFKPQNIKGFKNHLANVDWNFATNDDNPETSYSKFITKTTEILNIHCPLKAIKISNRKLARKPWITAGLLKSIRTKDKLYKKYLTKPTDDNKLKYTKYRNLLNNLLRSAKKSHITTELEINKFNMKETWKTLNNLLGRNKKCRLPDFFKGADGNKITDPKEIANNFNDFFTNIGNKLADKITPPDNNYVSPLKSKNQQSSIFLNPTNPEEIIKIVKKLKDSNSSGIDNISTKLLKSIIDEISPVLSHIFNRSILLGIVPSQLKIAKVNPIFKANDNQIFSNYRPISILPSISKILEKIIYNRLLDFVTRNNIFSPHQYGFRPNRSTHMAINDLYCKITSDLDNKHHCLGIFLDLSKAFDTLNHDILIDKLNSYGIRGIANCWIKNYLSNRKQYVVYNNIPSSYSDIICGVPQGSILGPLLFLLYINDLPLASPSSHFIIFADDTNILFSHKDPSELEKLINNELKNISNWFKLNKLSLNIDKTNYMIFKNKHNNKPTPNLKIEIDNKHIEKVDTTKFLGILIDFNLTWKAHTVHITKIVSKYNGIFRKVRPFLNTDSLHTLYNTLVLPYLSYCTIVWGDKNNANLDSLFLTQKKIIRTCTNSLWLAHTTPLFLSMKKFKIHDIYTYQLACHMFRYHNDLLPSDLPNNNFVTKSHIHDHYTRQTSDFHINPSNTKLAQNNIKTQGPIIWNKLNTKIKHCPSLAAFKYNLKKHILDQYNSSTTNPKYASTQ